MLLSIFVNLILEKKKFKLGYNVCCTMRTRTKRYEFWVSAFVDDYRNVYGILWEKSHKWIANWFKLEQTMKKVKFLIICWNISCMLLNFSHFFFLCIVIHWPIADKPSKSWSQMSFFQLKKLVTQNPSTLFIRNQ